MPKEIERKLVVARFPDVDAGVGTRIEQAYILLPRRNVAMRVRTEGGRKVLTFKGGGEAIRHEVNLDLTGHPEIFDLLWDNALESRIRKVRYTIPDGDGAVEIDVFEGEHPSLAGRILAEREFPSEEAMRAWKPPRWLADAGIVEVTGDERFGNGQLVVRGWPEE